MSETNEPLETNESQEAPHYPVKQSATFAGATFATMGLIDLLAHLGPTGLLVSGLASYVAWKHGPELYAQVREYLPLPAPLTQEEPAAQEEPAHPTERTSTRGRSWVDRAIGYFPEPEPEPAQDEPPAAAEQALSAEAKTNRAAMPSPAAGCLHLGERLHPHADLVLSNRFAILGMPNAGKSNTMAVLAEELGRLGVPLVLFDQKPEYSRLCTRPYLTNPCHASASTLTPQHARAFGQQIMAQRRQVVLDLPSYQDDDEAARVMIELISGIWQWESERPNDERLPCMLLLDEADYWLPQSEQHAHVDRSQRDAKGRSLFVRLQNTFFTVVHRGRSFGLGIIVCSQRPANVDNRAIAVAEWKLLLKANMPHDLAVYKSFGVAPEVAMRLGRGQAYVIGPAEITGVFQLRKRISPDDAQTPGLTHLQRAARQAATTPETLHSLRETGGAPLDLSAQLEPPRLREGMKRSVEVASPRHPRAALPSLLRHALAVLEPGMTYRELGAVLGYTDAEARAIFLELKRRGLLHGTVVTTGPQQTARKEGLAHPPQPAPVEPSELDRALGAYDAGHTTIDALAVALDTTPWKVRPLYQQVKRRRKGQHVG